MSDKTLQKYLSNNIDRINQLLFDINSSTSKSNEEFKNIKEDISGIVSKENADKINSIYSSLINDKIGTYKIDLSQLSEFWRDLRSNISGRQYKDIFDKFTNSFHLIKEKLNDFSINLIQQKNKPAHISGNFNVLNSIRNSDWINIFGELNGNKNFINLGKTIKDYLTSEFLKNLNEELISIKENNSEYTDTELNQFKLICIEKKISIKEYILKYKPKNQKTIEKPIFKPKKKIIPAKNNNNIDDFDNYKKYFNSDERELARMKRAGVYSSKNKNKRRLRKPGSKKSRGKS